MPDREKVIETFKERICTCSMIGDGFDVTINWRLADDILALLKEQNGLMLALDQSNAVNGYLNAEVERLNGLLKEQEAVVKQWTKEIADNQLAHAPDELDRENWDYKKGIWDGLQIAWNIISKGR